MGKTQSREEQLSDEKWSDLLKKVDEWDTVTTSQWVEYFYNRKWRHFPQQKLQPQQQRIVLSENSLRHLCDQLLIKNINGTKLLKLDNDHCLDELDIDHPSHIALLKDVVKFMKNAGKIGMDGMMMISYLTATTTTTTPTNSSSSDRISGANSSSSSKTELKNKNEKLVASGSQQQQQQPPKTLAKKQNKLMSDELSDEDRKWIEQGKLNLVVQQKLLEAEIVQDVEQATLAASRLSCKDTILEMFLSIEDQKYTFEQLLEQNIEKYSLSDDCFFIGSGSDDDEECENRYGNDKGNGDEDDDDDVIDINEVIASTREKLSFQNKREEEFLTVKLVIVEQNRFGHRLLQKLSPLMNRFHIAPEFGSFHVALIIGSWYFDWTTSSLIIPRKCYSNSSVLAIDLGRSFDFDVCDDDDMDVVRHLTPREVFARVSEAVAHYNTTQVYSIKNNCHHFVKDLANRLNLRLDFGGLLGTYMDNLRKSGQCKMKLDLSNHPLKQHVQKNDILFKTHSELDDFVCRYGSLLDSDDMLLLKSFDLAFWLRHFAQPDSDLYKPCQCPFGDPTATGAIHPNQSYKVPKNS